MEERLSDPGRVLLVRVWFDDEPRRHGFRARVVPNTQMSQWPALGVGAATPEQVLSLVQVWLDHVLASGS